MKRIISIQTIVTRSQFLNDLLRSVLHQNCHQWEHILLLNGMGEERKRALSLINKIYRQYEKTANEICDIKIFSCKKMGVGEARKKLFGLTKSSYILPLDDDDMLAPTAVEVLLKKIAKHPQAPLLRASHMTIDAKTTFDDILFNYDLLKKKVYVPTRISRFGMTEDIFNVDQLYLIKKSTLRTISPLKTYRDFSHMGEEIDLFLKAEEIGKITSINQVLYFKRKHNNNILSRFPKNKIIELGRRYAASAIKRRGLKVKVESIKTILRKNKNSFLPVWQLVFRYKNIIAPSHQTSDSI